MYRSVNTSLHIVCSVINFTKFSKCIPLSAFSFCEQLLFVQFIYSVLHFINWHYLKVKVEDINI